MWTLVIATTLGMHSLSFDTLESCRSAGHNLLHHERVLNGSPEGRFYCVERATGAVWSSVALPAGQGD